jgi:DHA1 family bicyclomycin/chloramphenicol resistance-like MFS transporter
MVRDLYEGPRAGRELSRMSTIMGVVPAAAPILGGLLQEAFGWRANFVASMVFSAAPGLVTLTRVPETILARSATPVPFLAVLRGFRSLLAPELSRPRDLVVAGPWRAVRLHLGLLLRAAGVYGLSELAFAFSLAFMVTGFMAGSFLSNAWWGGLVSMARSGLASRPWRSLAGPCWRSALSAPSSFSVTEPMALYAISVGLTMPQAITCSIGPFPRRAGAASSLPDLCQMTFAALLGIGLGLALGQAAPRR